MQFYTKLIFMFPIIFGVNGAEACATCLCGDPTITTMGTEKPFAGRTRVSVDYLDRGETVGVARHDQKVEEQRISYNVSYAVNSKWMFAASLPMVDKQVKRFDLSHEKSSGVGDIDLSARWFVGADQHVNAKNLWGMQMGLRLPTSTEEKISGVAIDFDAQAGAGATVPSLGFWIGHYQQPWFFYGSAMMQHAITEGYQHYEQGDVFLITGLMQYALNYHWALQLGADSRWKEKDHYEEKVDNDSGGLLVLASPGLVWTPIEDVVVNLGLQIPVIENTYGHQKEENTLRFGVAYDL